jgi:PAS domain S-box-containing protein
MEMSPDILLQLVTNSPDAVVLTSTDAIVLYVNPAACALYGYCKDDLIGQHVNIFNAEGDYDVPALASIVGDTGKWEGEVVQKRKDGSQLNILLSIFPVFGASGQVIGYSSNSKNVSEWKLVNQRVAESEAYYKLLTENAPMRIVHLSNTGSILYMQNPASSINDDAVGKTVFDFLPEEFHGLYKEKLRDAVSSRAPINFRVMGRRQDGEEMIWYHTFLNPVVIDGVTASIVMVFRDIDNDVRTAEDLERTKASLKAIINNTEDIIVSIDRNFNILEFNNVLAEKTRLGFGFDLKRGMPMLSIIDAGKHTKLENIYKRVLKGEIIKDVEKFDITSEFHLYFETSYYPILNEETGEVTGISIFSKDITDRVNQQRLTEKALHEKEVLLSEIHHRLKNNLAVISSILELQGIQSDNEEVYLILKESQTRIKSSALIHEMFYEHDSIDRIDTVAFCERLFGELRNSFGANYTTLNIEGGRIKLSLGKAVPFGLLMNELMVNSLKHGLQENSALRIHVNIECDESGSVVILYTDGGCGFDESFNFETAHSTGMVLIKTFAEQLDGTIQLQNKSKAQFRIQLGNIHD